MNKRESNKKVGIYKKSTKMKRIALVFLSIMSLVACNNDPIPEPPEHIGGKEISLNINIPKNSISTYANENADEFENYIDSVYVVLSQGGSEIDRRGFSRADINPASGKTYEFLGDTAVKVGYEVDNMSTGALTVEVFANTISPKTIANEIALPNKTQATSFYMSGEGSLTLNPSSGVYEGSVSVIRNVAKLRVNVSMNSVYIPEDLKINYDDIIVEVVKTPNITSDFENSPIDLPNSAYIGYTPRTSTGLRRSSSFVSTGDEIDRGGQIDSLYLYENRRVTAYDPGNLPNVLSNNKTQIKITIPTQSASEGNKTADYTYALYTNLPTVSHVLRNHIYTLNIKVRGQSLEPLITLDLDPWEDVNIKSDIGGTYLTTDVSEIVFDPISGKATINFCTDAQAVYFDFKTFNENNPGTTLAFNDVSIIADGITPTDPLLSPAGFQDGQILLDKGHCGSFSFTLEKDSFPKFPNVNFSGSICIKAGNIEKCFTFPAKNTYDAHFIVGERLFGTETFTSASVDGGANGWLEVSPDQLYTNNVSHQYSGAASPIYLHLNEYITTTTDEARTGFITLVNNKGVRRKIQILQLPALNVGRFGQTSTIDTPAFNATLWTEQIHEYETLVQYGNTASVATPASAANFIYNGFAASQVNSGGVLDLTKYNTSPYFNYQAAAYSAANYCLYKNRPTSKTSSGALAKEDIKWYLPAQAQLMGMWVSYEAYKAEPTSTFYPEVPIGSGSHKSQAYWSVTGNADYTNEAQYLNFAYGNVGHTKMYMPGEGNKRYWARCVRNGNTSTSMVNASTPTLNFANSGGMPAGSYINSTKGDGAGDENSANNKTLYQNLRVAIKDATANPVAWNINLCNTYTESGVTGAWRLPTQRELQAIWILQSEIKNRPHATFDLLDDDYYWSATSASEASTNAWVVYGSINLPGGSGNTPHRHKNELSRVRCVHE